MVNAFVTLFCGFKLSTVLLITTYNYNIICIEMQQMQWKQIKLPMNVFLSTNNTVLWFIVFFSRSIFRFYENYLIGENSLSLFQTILIAFSLLYFLFFVFSVANYEIVYCNSFPFPQVQQSFLSRSFFLIVFPFIISERKEKKEKKIKIHYQFFLFVGN